jgi:hypothetical protein
MNMAKKAYLESAAVRRRLAQIGRHYAAIQKAVESGKIKKVEFAVDALFSVVDSFTEEVREQADVEHQNSLAAKVDSASGF